MMDFHILFLLVQFGEMSLSNATFITLLILSSLTFISVIISSLKLFQSAMKK